MIMWQNIHLYTARVLLFHWEDLYKKNTLPFYCSANENEWKNRSSSNAANKRKEKQGICSM